jgi:hypothetical protein
MSTILAQSVTRLNKPNSHVVLTVVKLTAASDSVDLPRMSSTTGAVAQIRRVGDPAVTVSQSDIDTVSLTGTVGDEILLVSHSNSPIPNPVS